MIFVDGLRRHPDVIAKSIRDALDREFSGTPHKDAVEGAIISLEPLAAAEKSQYWSFLGFQELN